MLTALELENFKGIASRQRIEFAPLTLLFGANSAGKSTILQALIYLHELLERGSADVDRTDLGGDVIELGGFPRLVHQHDVNRTMRLRAEFETPGALELFGRSSESFPFPDLEDEVGNAWLELEIRNGTWTAFTGALVERAFLGVQGDKEPLVWLEVGTSLREGEPLNVRVNMGHRLLAGLVSNDGEALPGTDEWWSGIEIPDPPRPLENDVEGKPSEGEAGLAEWSGWADGRQCPWFAVTRTRDSALPSSNEPLRVVPFGDDLSSHQEAQEHVRRFLEMTVLGTTTQLLSFLREASYIGPLRTIPPRGFLYERPGRLASWADGLAAWDLLLADRLDLVERTNEWLKKLDSGCRIEVQQLVDGRADAEQVSSSHVDRTVRRLMLRTRSGSLVLPSEVGAGISQVIPVLVAALASLGDLCLVEQPELHVHPALQVSLGDLLIDEVVHGDRQKVMLIETHSEHLILRLLRRIRETAGPDHLATLHSLTTDQLSVTHVESGATGVTIRRLHVDDSGDFIDEWPRGFFEERRAELF